MKALGLHTIPVADIDYGMRLRAVDPAHAALIAENIRQTGRLRSPVEVRKVKARKGQRPYCLIAGGHRLWAVGDILGWREVEAFVFECSDDEAKLAEVDENLVRHELNPLDRAVFLAERKDIWERLHPETKAGIAGGKARQGAATEIISFARDTAERCGITERTVQLAVSIARDLAPEARRRLAGTAFARKQSELLALAKLAPEHQLRVLDLLLAEEPAARSVEAARRLVLNIRDRDDADEKDLARLLRAWGDASPAVRRGFLAHLRETGQLAAAPEMEAA